MPLRYLLLIIIMFVPEVTAFWPFTQAPSKPFSIMLDPAGDARTPGRIIEDIKEQGGYERGVTLLLAEEIKKRLEETLGKKVRVVLTRFPGETLDPLQNANFANRLDVDAYISIHFFHQKEDTPLIYLYHFVYNPITDMWAKVHRLSFYPYDQAHLAHISKTGVWIEQCKNILRNDTYKKSFDVKGPYGIPFKPLIGVKAPAIAFEIGLKNKSDWTNYVAPLTECLNNLVQMAGS